MPQMAPLSWLVLFLSFTFIFIIFLAFCYFINFSSEAPNSSFSSKNISMSWEW